MKTINQVICCSFVLLASVSCKTEPKTNEIAKKSFLEIKQGYPKEFGPLRKLLNEEFDRLDVSINASSVDSVWAIDFMKIEKTYGALFLSYRIYPKKLSTEKKRKCLSINVRRSCIVDEYASKRFFYKNYFLEPGFGHIAEGNKQFVDAFYKELKKLGAKETKDDFLEPSRNTKQ